MLGNFTYCNPTKLYFGKNALDGLNKELPRYGKNIMLIYGGGMLILFCSHRHLPYGEIMMPINMRHPPLYIRNSRRQTFSNATARKFSRTAALCPIPRRKNSGTE